MHGSCALMAWIRGADDLSEKLDAPWIRGNIPKDGCEETRQVCP